MTNFVGGAASGKCRTEGGIPAVLPKPCAAGKRTVRRAVPEPGDRNAGGNLPPAPPVLSAYAIGKLSGGSLVRDDGQCFGFIGILPNHRIGAAAFGEHVAPGHRFIGIKLLSVFAAQREYLNPAV